MTNTVIQFKRTNVPSSVPNTSDPSNTQYIVAGELAINMADGLVYTSNGSADGLIAIGAKQKTFQSTTITVSDTFQIGDIETQMLKANSTTILAGNTSVNATVSTTLIAVQNATSSSLINPKEIFVGNSSVNAQFNLVGGNADLIVDSFAYDSTTFIATFGTSTPHNLVYPPKGTYVTLSNMTGPASPYNGVYEVANILSPTTFTVANVTFGGTVAVNSTSVSRTAGYTKLLTTSNHGFANGSQIIVSGVGPDLKDPDFTFDGTFTVVNSVAASRTLQYTQYPIVTTSPSSMYKLAGDNFVTYKTDTSHNLSANFYISTNSYPSGVSTPIRTQASVNAVAFATLVSSGYDKTAGAVAGKAGVGGSIYMLVDSADTDYKIFNKLQTVPVTLETNSGTYEDIYTRTITSAFYDPVTLTKAGAVQNIIITLSQPLYALGGGVLLTGFTGAWAFLNDKQLPIAEITTATAYGKILTNGSYASAPAYDRYKCYSINVTGIANISTVPNKSLLPFYNSADAVLTVRVPINMGAIPNISKASQMAVPGTSPRYLIRIDNTSTSQDVNSTSSDLYWARDGAYRYGLITNRKMSYTTTGWNSRNGTTTGAARTLTINFGVDVSSFSVDQWCLLMGNFGIDWVRSAGTSFANIAGTSIGIYKITAVNNTTKSITFDWTNGPTPYIGSWYNGGWANWYYTSDYTWDNVVLQPFITLSSKVKMTARMDRAINTPTKINSIINSTAFTMQLNSAENAATTYGSYEAPLPVVSGSFTRNTDVGAGKPITRPAGPKSPPAYITYDSTGVVSGDCHIEYSSYVEVTNSSSGIRITPTTFYSGNNSANLFSNSSTLAISSPSNALKLGTGGFSVTGSTAGKYDPSKPVLSVNSSVLSIGTGLKGITIDGSGKIKQYGSELDIGTEIANVFINEYSITINSNDQQTVINATSSIFPGNVSIGGSLYVGESYGDIGQVLATDGVGLFWTDNGIDFTVDHKFEANLAVKGTISPGLIDVIDDVGNEVTIDSDISYYTSNTLEQLTVSASAITLFSNDEYSNTTTIRSATIKVGNSTVNSTINSSAFSGTSNNTLYVGSVTAANVVSNAQLTDNLARYAALSGATFTGNVNVGNIYSSGLLSINAASGLMIDQQNAGSFLVLKNNGHEYKIYPSGPMEVGGALIGGSYGANRLDLAGAAILEGGNFGAQIKASDDRSTYYTWTFGADGFVYLPKGISANGSNGSAGQVLTSAGGGNVYWSTVTGGTGGGTYTFSTGLTNTSDTITVNSAYIATLAANSAAYLGGVAAASYVTATNLSDNLANYSTTTATSSNAATAYTNAASYADNKAGTAYTNAVSYVDTKNFINATSNYTISGIYNHTANIVVNGAIIAAGGPGTAGQVLTSNGSGNVYWSTVTSGVGVNTDAQYTWTNTQTFSNLISIGANASIDFNTTTYKPSFLKGRMYWDNEEQTIVVYGDGSSFEQTMGQREWVRCRNSTASTIAKGTPVYITGVHIPGNPVHGHHPTVAPGDASDYNKSQIVGLAGEDILAGAHGYVVVRGYIEGINTSSLTSGQRAHLGFATPGTIVLTAPEYPNYPTDLGMCLTSDATNGTFYVDLAMHTAERFRTTQDMYVGGSLSVGGDLNVTGNIVSTSTTNLSVSDNIIYVGQGDTISPAATTFTGSGLNDMVFHGVFEGTSSVHYYVKIDSVGGTDTFAWSKNNFSTTIASGIAITGNPQTLDNGIKVQFNATTGHTLNDKWDGTGAPVNVDLGWVGNYNDGTYQHSGLFRDASDGVYKFFQGYTPEPDAAVNIDTGHVSFQFASIQANVVTANLVGTANNANNLGGLAPSSYVTTTSLSTTLGGYSTTTATSANAATAYSNASLYTDNRILTVNSAITGNATTAYTNSMADTLSRNGTYTGNNIFNGTNTVINSNTTHVGNSVFNGANNFFNSMLTIGAVPAAAANSVSANTTAIRIGNSTVYSTINSTSVNTAAGSLSISSTGLALTSAVNEVELRITGKTGVDIPVFAVNSTTVSFTSMPLTANGTTGTSGQVLTSNGTTGAPYWSTVTSGGGSWAGGTMANSVLFSNTTSSVNATSGAVVITGGLGVNNNIYTAGRVGFANSSTSVAYTYYNAVTDSLDTVFG